MDKPIYDLKASEDGHFYFFKSIGKESVKKAIVYIPLNNSPSIVELAFGDIKRTILLIFIVPAVMMP